MVFDMSHILEQVQVTITDAQWMRSAHSWRVLCELPTGDIALAPAMARLIDTQVDMFLQGQLSVVIYPAHIVNVKHSKGKFTAIFETCYEKQNEVGPLLIGLIGTTAFMTVTKAGSPKLQPASKDQLKGLHVLFQNPRFQQFVQAQATSRKLTDNVVDARSAKVAFKAMAGIDSCRELPEATHKEWVNSFNGWLNRGKV